MWAGCPQAAYCVERLGISGVVLLGSAKPSWRPAALWKLLRPLEACPQEGEVGQHPLSAPVVRCNCWLLTLCSSLWGFEAERASHAAEWELCERTFNFQKCVSNKPSLVHCAATIMYVIMLRRSWQIQYKKQMVRFAWYSLIKIIFLQEDAKLRAVLIPSLDLLIDHGNSLNRNYIS